MSLLLLGALIAVNAEPFAKPSDESMEVIAAAERENEDKILNAMMNHIVASVMQSNDDGLMSMMMGENISGEHCAQLQWKFFKHIRKGLKKVIRSPLTGKIIKYGLKYGPYLGYLGKK